MLLARERHLGRQLVGGEPARARRRRRRRPARRRRGRSTSGRARSSGRTGRGTRRATRPARPRARSPRGTRAAARRAAPRPPRGTRRAGPSSRVRGSIVRRAEQHAAVALEHALHRGRRVRPVLRAAAGARRGGRSGGPRARGRSAGRAASRPGGSPRQPRRTASESRGQASLRPVAEVEVGEARRARCRPRGRPRGTPPLRPKWPNVRGELRVPVQCGGLPSRSSRPEAPVVRLEAAEARAGRRPGPGTARSPPRRASRRRCAVGSSSSRATTSSVVSGASTPWAGEPREREAPDRLEVARRTASRRARRRARPSTSKPVFE